MVLFVDLINKMVKNCTFAAKLEVVLILNCEPAFVANY